MAWRSGEAFHAASAETRVRFLAATHVTVVVGKPTVPEVLPLVERLFEHPVVCCCLHITLHDGNVADKDVASCIAWAREARHPYCERLAELLARMSKTQRRKLYREFC